MVTGRGHWEEGGANACAASYGWDEESRGLEGQLRCGETHEE